MRSRRHRDDDDDEDEEDRPMRPRARRSGPSTVIVGSIVVSVFALIGIILLVVSINDRRDRRDEKLAQAEKKREPLDDGKPDPRPEPPPDPPPGGPGRPEVMGDGDKPPPTPPRKSPAMPLAPSLPPQLDEKPASGTDRAKEPYREFYEDGTILIGFEVGCEQVDARDVISYLRPIYRTRDGFSLLGAPYGQSKGKIVTVKAEKDYALGAILIRHKNFIEGIRFTYMRVVPGGLNPEDSNTSDWYGDQSSVPPVDALKLPRGLVPQTVGIHGMRFEETGDDSPTAGSIGSLGLVYTPIRGTPTVSPSKPELKLAAIDWPSPRPLPYGWQQSKTIGEVFPDVEFNEVRTDGSILFGFEVGTDIQYFRPIWLTPAGVEEFGIAYGTKSDAVTTLKAKDGFAVSGMVAAGGSPPPHITKLEGFSLIFTKRVPRKGLSTSPKDVYTSEWIGEKTTPAQGAPLSVLGGFPITGIHGQRDSITGNIKSMGFIVPNKADGWPIVPPLEKLSVINLGRTKLMGDETTTLKVLEDVAPPGGWLVGVEAIVIPWKGVAVIGSVRPLYQTEAKSSDGARLGKPWDKKDKAVRAIAKPGYAVGAITLKAGVEVSGFSVTFMKVKGGKLDPKDTYESPWIGNNGAVPKGTFGGDGSPVVGLQARVHGDDPVRALGLVVAGGK